VGLPTFNSGGGNGRRTDQREIDKINPPLAAEGRELAIWAAMNAGLLIAVAAVGLGLMLVLLVLSFIAQGGMAQATADLATGHPSSLRSAWRAGVHLFWRYIGLWLLFAATAIAIAAVVAAAAVAAFAFQAPGLGIGIAAIAAAIVIVSFVAIVLRVTRTTTAPRWLVALGAMLFTLPLLTVLVLVGLVLSIVVVFAQRAIVVENVGPIDALQSGWRLARGRQPADVVGQRGPGSRDRNHVRRGRTWSTPAGG
jgi:hypothetical protein